MTENELIITIQKVDKGTEPAEALLEFVKNFSWNEVKEHTIRVIKNWEFEEWETPFVAMADDRMNGNHYENRLLSLARDLSVDINLVRQ